MVWQGLTDRQLCELFKDPLQNGNRDVNEIVKHMSTPLVLWGWNPGGNRAPVPVPHDIFVTQFKLWADAGGPCPVVGS